MDVGIRFNNRQRTQSYSGRGGDSDALPDDSSAGEDVASRRKFQRTTTDTNTSHDGTSPFRRPMLPASATTSQLHSQQSYKSGFSSLHQRRRSAALRENVRVPSGPREFPSPGKRISSTSSSHQRGVPSLGDNTNPQQQSRGSFVPQITGEPFFSKNGEVTRFSFGNHSSNSNDSPTTPAEHTSGSFDFLPAVNFDDFQATLANLDGQSPLLTDFPTHSGGRILPKEDGQFAGDIGGTNTAKSNGFHSAMQPRGPTERPGFGQQDSTVGLTRGQSFRKRMSSISGQGRQDLQSSSTATVPQQSSIAPVTKASMNEPLAVRTKASRKSVGPGLMTDMMAGLGRRSNQRAATASQEPAPSKSTGIVLNNSTSKQNRRSTIQPSTSGVGSDAPRQSTLLANTASRAAKVKSFIQPSSKSNDPNTPQSHFSLSRPTSKGNLRATTPSSSGNKRQSTTSGRASGLGARTISPTDARRLKRLSMVNAPPMPSAQLPRATQPSANTQSPKQPPTPSADELPVALQGTKLPFPELPRSDNRSPSLIPRKASHTPSSGSARASPDSMQSGLKSATNVGPRGSGVSLSSKSSFQSLLASSASNSRLPTPKARVGNSFSALGSYSSSGGGVGLDSFGEDELVPPVPAIPKAYGSPRGEEPPFFSEKSFSQLRGTSAFSGRSKASGHEGPWEPTMGNAGVDFDGNILPTFPFEGQIGSARTSSDVQVLPGPISRKQAAGDDIGAKQELERQPSLGHRRIHTAGTATAAPRPPTYDPTGRKNANLQPLRLPPLNLLPLTTDFDSDKASAFSRPRNDSDVNRSHNADFSSVQTPEPKRIAKTPSTPMTASKASFFKHSQPADHSNYMRSSSSHFALRDVLGNNTFGNDATRWFDESDFESNTGYRASVAGGVPIPQGNRQHDSQRGITPFASGSLPKGSGEYVRHAAGGLSSKPSGEYFVSGDEFSLGHFDNLQLQSAKPLGPRPKTTGTATAKHFAEEVSTPVSATHEHSPSVKKEPSSGGLRRRLSISWRRSTSKAASHAANDEMQQEIRAKQSKEAMPPPKVPASASGNGDVPSNAGRRPSTDATTATASRRKSTASMMSFGILGGHGDRQPPVQEQHATQLPTVQPRLTKLHSEQPQPVHHHHAATRSSSWGSFSMQRNQAANGARQHKGRQASIEPPINALNKDKDDLSADDEMRRLSQKRRDVDTAAREAEALWQRARPRDPVSPERLLHDRNATLNIFERGEIIDYEKDGVYFAGTRSAKKIPGSLASSPLAIATDKADAAGKDKIGNYGYDDERGDYNIVLGDHLAYRYEVIDILGKGSFGQVVRCVDHKEGGVVAVKIIRNKKRFHQQALVEVGILGKLRDWDPDGAYATLSITSSFYFRNHLCIVTPCLGMNLYELIRAHNFTGFSLPLIRRFARQLLACLILLQQKRIIHCDLKPENILLCEARKADVRVIDFGSSCREEEKVYTYIQSRFYRSPEVILGSTYGLGIDMWSFGCILAELWTGYPIFPGENEQEQLACIMEIFGPPEKRIIDTCTRKKLFFDSMGKPRVTVSSKGRRRRPSSKTLQQSLKTDDEAFVDFIARCLRWDPDRRLKPQDAVNHPFITNTSMQKRQGIPDEARRAAKLRSTAAVPTPAAAANGGPGSGTIPSPVKRAARTNTEDNTTGSLGSQQATPAKIQQRRDMPGTPQTAVRNAPIPSFAQSSPSKATIASANRRHSTLPAAAGAATMASAATKRASNAAALDTSGGGRAPMPRTNSGRPGPDLAQMAAATSMGSASAGANGFGPGRWKA